MNVIRMAMITFAHTHTHWKKSDRNTYVIRYDFLFSFNHFFSALSLRFGSVDSVCASFLLFGVMSFSLWVLYNVTHIFTGHTQKSNRQYFFLLFIIVV